MHRRGLWPPDDVERYGLVGVAAKAPDLEIWVSPVDGIADRWRRLRGTFVAEHPLVPCHTGKLVSLLACVPGALGRHLDLSSEEVLARLRGHAG